MKKLIVVIGIILTVGLAASAQDTARPSGAVYSVVGIKAFSPEANFLSLPGLLRWQYFVENGIWISPREAEDLVRQQLQ